MQTIEQFMSVRKVKTKKTVTRWITEGYIPGATKDDTSREYLIPDNARRPYVERGKCEGYTIYQSIVNAAIKGKHVVHQLYSIPVEEFNFYVKCLVDWGYIIAYEAEGIVYYNATESGKDFASWRNSLLSKYFKELVPLLAFGTSYGVISASN